MKYRVKTLPFPTLVLILIMGRILRGGLAVNGSRDSIQQAGMVLAYDKYKLYN